jgi:hypothetical protein
MSCDSLTEECGFVRDKISDNFGDVNCDHPIQLQVADDSRGTIKPTDSGEHFPQTNLII